MQLTEGKTLEINELPEDKANKANRLMKLTEGQTLETNHLPEARLPEKWLTKLMQLIEK